MDNYDNLAPSDLHVAKIPKKEVSKRIREALALVKLDGVAHRRTGELAGEQVSASRCQSVDKPAQAQLLDEPLPALHPRVRWK